MPEPPQPPYRICGPRIVLRCFQPSDAARMMDLIADNESFLRPWMPWAQSEPVSFDERVATLRRFRGLFDLGQEFPFGICLDGGARLIGACALHPRCGPGGFEAGYWIDHAETGHGYATEAAALLTRVGIEVLDAGRIEIHVDPANAPSLAIPERLAYKREGVLRQRLPWPDGTMKDKVIWTLLAADFPATPSAQVPMDMFDVLERPMHPGPATTQT